MQRAVIVADARRAPFERRLIHGSVGLPSGRALGVQRALKDGEIVFDGLVGRALHGVQARLRLGRKTIGKSSASDALSSRRAVNDTEWNASGEMGERGSNQVRRLSLPAILARPLGTHRQMELHGLLDHVGAMQHCGERRVDATRGGGRGEQQTGDGVRVTQVRRLR